MDMNTADEKRYVLGCDIGNGYGYVSLLADPQKDPMPLFPSTYHLMDIGMPTAAYITPPAGETIEVFSHGKAAEIRYKGKSEQIVRAIKTRFREGSIQVPGIENPVEATRIYSAIVRDLLSLAQEELANKGIGPVYDMVFTFPAAFADDTVLLEKMQRSIEEIEMEGQPVNVLGRLPEPAAVAIDYLHYMQHIAPDQVRIKEKSFTVLVYDLGHGTFDTAVVTARSEGVPYQLHSKAGLAEVGGKNFEEILYQEILSRLQEQYGFVPGNERHRELVRQEAVKAKIALSDNAVYTASVMKDEEYCEIEITRERFEQLSQHLLFQTLELVQKVLDEAAEANIKIDGIVLSGGASKMPMVRKNLEQLVEGEYPIVLYRPSEAVSFGAARFARGIGKKQKNTESIVGDQQPLEGNPVMEQMTDCCYGIWLPVQGKLEGEVRFLVPSGKRRPYTSEPMSFISQSSRVVVKLFRSKVKNQVMEAASPKECESMMWIPFEVNPQARCEVSVTVLENYGIQVELHSDRGDHDIKTTWDMVEKLI